MAETHRGFEVGGARELRNKCGEPHGAAAAGIRVSDYKAAKAWYERLLVREPSFIAHATQARLELAEHRSLDIEARRAPLPHARC